MACGVGRCEEQRRRRNIRRLTAGWRSLDDAFAIGRRSKPGVAIFRALSSLIANAPLAATGASLTGLTVIMTVATLEPETPSLALYVKLSVPLKLAAGV